MEIIKDKESFKKGRVYHLDHIYNVQGLLPEGVWLNGTEWCEEMGINDEFDERIPKLDGLSIFNNDDFVVFMKSVDVEFKVRVKDK